MAAEQALEAQNPDWTITISLCERVENHVGMQQIGDLAEDGFSIDELVAAAAGLRERAQLVRLDYPGDVAGLSERDTRAAVLVVRNMFGPDALQALYNEQRALNVDKKALMRGRVVNKHARWNLCFDDAAQEPNIAAGRGRVIAWDSVPHLREVRAALPHLLQSRKAENLKAEGNYYYGPKCYIGFHGDSERKRVVALRLGAPMPLHFQWFRGGRAVGERVQIDLRAGDMYVMSEKAVGHDWKRRVVPTLRHAAGSVAALGL